MRLGYTLGGRFGSGGMAESIVLVKIEEIDVFEFVFGEDACELGLFDESLLSCLWAWLLVCGKE